MTGQELLYDGQEMVVQGNVVNKGKIKSMIPIELRGENAKIDNLEGEGSEIFAAGMIVGEGTLVDNKGTLIIGEAPRELVIGSNHYSIGDFGAAGVWMTENLRETTGLTENASGTNSTNKQYTHVNKSAINDVAYGLLYNWYGATLGQNEVTDNQGNQSGQTQIQGICPTGWHLPSDYEWSQLEEVIAKEATGLYSTTLEADNSTDFYTTADFRGTNSGRKMKSTTAVNVQDTDGSSNAKNLGGFEGLLTGSVEDGTSSRFDDHAFWWTSSTGSWKTYAYRRALTWSKEGSYRNQANDKSLYYAVRCKQN
ncbi:hypothetical protein FACS189440_15420 [Bacteroidia bacterium]|nr:hypothetical protein FACS189423_02300 [Bacteroidia bacterium]GHT49525.1 hypothetical protein FACS189440_15420 [Bacteroidia bacterium]